MGIIEVKNLSKTFKVYEQQPGFRHALKSFFKRDTRIVQAVQNLSFSVDAGELVGFIGENGAGKSTTIKVMTGILYPTEGEVLVREIRPYENRKQNAMRIGVIFGQRSRLLWDLPMLDSFELYREIYQVEQARYRRNVALFTELLDMGTYLKTPVRQLSLGQRMKADIALALLHDPEILYLDEPTIGLDVLAKSNIRQFIRESNRLNGTTTILTSHDMKDLDQVCSRVVMISRGHLHFDGDIRDFKNRFGGEVQLKVTFMQNGIELQHKHLQVVTDEGLIKTICFHKNDITLQEAMATITGRYQVADISVTEADIEQIVKDIYQKNHQTDAS
jgi:ABC-2 type transport system ATP-binding protein